MISVQSRLLKLAKPSVTHNNPTSARLVAAFATKAKMAPTLKLIYFELPGRAEPTRLMLAHAGVKFEDSIVTRETWPSIKATTPFGQVPVLEVDGKPLAESAAIERYVGSIAGLVPSDPWAFAKAEEAIAFTQEIADALRPTYSIADPEEKIKARQALLAGALGAKLERLQALLEANGGEYFACNQLSYADFHIYSGISMFISGFLDGFPKDLLDKYPGLKAHHNRIASLPAVAAKYETVTEGLRVAYKVLP